jgi:hypothetical protein
MVLGYYGHHTSMDEVLRAALEAKAFDGERGWRHSELVSVLHSFGLKAYRRNWRLMDGREREYLAGRPHDPAAADEIALIKLQLLDEGKWRIRRLLDQHIPVILSVYRPWGDFTSIGHQVVIVDADDEVVTFHDPALLDGQYSRRNSANFFSNWKGTAIVAHSVVSPNRG